jgi:tetratricopeptide (TPR) repeat protein
METLQLVCLHWISEERDKYVWEDLYVHSWDEIIGRMYLLKAHSILEQTRHQRQRVYYKEALTALKQALTLLAKDEESEEYYYRALADKAVVQCYLGRYESVLSEIDEALSKLGDFYQSILKSNRAAVLVLTGMFAQALTLLEQELHEHPEDTDLQVTRATCLLHLERYDEACAAYEQAEKDYNLPDKRGLLAARQHRQPDWGEL